MSAIVKRMGAAHVGAVCNAPECQDINGRPWQIWYPTRTVEGALLAGRDVERHNAAHHTDPVYVLGDVAWDSDRKFAQDQESRPAVETSATIG